MNVSDLIKILEKMPKECEVMHIWDGQARTTINQVWLSISGKVMTSDDGEVVYSKRSRPVGADKFERWVTPGDGL